MFITSMKQMYKVFLNDRSIQIGSPGNIGRNKSVVTFSDSYTVADIQNWFNVFSKNSLREVYLVNSNPEEFFMRFQSAFKVLHAAGGVVISNNKLLFIFRNDKWDLPKGKLDKNELAEEAALREVTEETGIVPDGIDRRLPTTFHIYPSPDAGNRGKWIFKNTYWFQMNYTGPLTGTPQQEEGITLVKWVDKGSLKQMKTNTYENLKQIINLYHP